MRACGLCGSDLEKIYGEYGMASGRLGHEPAGESRSNRQICQRLCRAATVYLSITMLHAILVITAFMVTILMCPAYQSSNISPCGLAEHFLVPEWNVSRGGLIKLPDNVRFDEASLIEPLACCIKGMEEVQLPKGRRCSGTWRRSCWIDARSLGSGIWGWQDICH